jgi:hypothetical protein
VKGPAADATDAPHPCATLWCRWLVFFFSFFHVMDTGGMKLTGGNRSTRGRNSLSATSSTKNPTWTGPGSKPGLRGERPVADRLSRGAAKTMRYVRLVTKPPLLRRAHTNCLQSASASRTCDLRESRRCNRPFWRRHPGWYFSIKINLKL